MIKSTENVEEKLTVDVIVMQQRYAETQLRKTK